MMLLALLSAQEVETLAIVIVVIAGFTAAFKLLFPLAKALAARLEGRGAEPAVRGELEELRGRVQDLEARDHRLLELEERLDFAERLLTQARLAAPSDGGSPPEPSRRR